MDYFFYNTDAKALSEQPQPRFHVLVELGFAAVGGDRHQFGEQLAQLAPDDVLLMYENGIGVVAIGRVRASWDGLSHATPQYYKSSEMSSLTGGSYEYRIAVEWFLDLSGSPIGIEELRGRFGYTPRGTLRRIVEQRIEAARIIEESRVALALLPEEVAQPTLYVEGATRRVSVNAYERSRDAVIQCKAALGTICVICGFDFGTVYGAEFAGFVHVHHLRPLSEIGGEYVVDPVADLRPVCPNCHAVIHHGGRLRSIDEVRQPFGASGRLTSIIFGVLAPLKGDHPRGRDGSVAGGWRAGGERAHG
jgi:hypothetical protein